MGAGENVDSVFEASVSSISLGFQIERREEEEIVFVESVQTWSVANVEARQV